MQPLISVIVPVYNVEKYLNKCVESIVNQTYKNLEIILVDDGSTDTCPQMCDEWAKKDNRIKVIHKQNGGLSSARNAGMAVMLGKYVLFIDSDDYIGSSMAEEMYNNIIKDDFDVCLCNSYSVDSDYNIISRSEHKAARIYGEEIIKDYLDGNVFDSFSACDKLYKTAVLKEHNLNFDESIKWGEDYPFNYYFFRVIQKMIVLDEAYYYYLAAREGSITFKVSSGLVNRWRNFKAILNEEAGNKVHYEIMLSKYASELMCCLRELFKGNDQALIRSDYFVITDEIKKMAGEFLKCGNMNPINKLTVRLIVMNDKLFKLLFEIYLKIKRN